MWLVAGLGNPGTRYAKTRHNAGFFVLDELAGRCSAVLAEKKDCLMARGSIGGHTVILVEPLTFMNNSGSAVGRIASRNGIEPQNVIAVHDDLDLETGIVKIRRKGSSGGHKGIASLIEHLGSQEFVRVKIGIGRSPGVAVEEYVLQKFRPEEKQLIADAVKRAADAVEAIVASGSEKAMNKFN